MRSSAVTALSGVLSTWPKSKLTVSAIPSDNWLSLTAGTGDGTVGLRLAPTLTTEALSTRIRPLEKGTVSVMTTWGVLPSGMVTVISKVADSPTTRSGMPGRNWPSPVSVSDVLATALVTATDSTLTVSEPLAA